MSINLVVLTGRLVKDPETRYTADNLAITKYTLAVDGYRKDHTDFINCTAMGKAGEFAAKYFTKGKRVEVQGRWETGSYTKKDGTKVYTNDCMVTNQGFGESKGESNNPMPEVNTAKADFDDFVAVPEGIQEELPFA